MVLSDNREFSMMVGIFILIPILPLLLLFTATRTGKIAPNSVQNQNKKAKPTVEISVIIDI